MSAKKNIKCQSPSSTHKKRPETLKRSHSNFHGSHGTSFWSVVNRGHRFDLKKKEHVVKGEKARSRIHGRIELDDQHLLVTNSFTVRIYIPSIDFKRTPYLSTPVAENGTWEIDLFSFDFDNRLLEITKESKPHDIELKVFNANETQWAKKKINSESAFKNFHTIKLPSVSPKLDLDFIYQIKIIDLPEDIKPQFCVLELWDSSILEGKPIATTKQQRENIFKFKFSKKVEVDLQKIKVSWVRLVDAKKKTDYGSCPIIISRHERFPNVQTVRINKNMPKLFELSKKVEYAKSLLTAPILRRFCKLGVATLGDIQKHSKNIPENISGAFLEVKNNLIDLFPRKETEILEISPEALMERMLELLERGGFAPTIPVYHCWLTEEQWQYRFSTWSLSDTAKNKTINKYVQCAEAPPWREKIYSFFNSFDRYRFNILQKHKITDWMSAQGMKIQNILSDPNSSASFSINVEEALEELEQLNQEIQTRLDALENMNVSRVKITTRTGGGSHDGTNDYVEHSTYIPIIDVDEGVQRGSQPARIRMGDENEYRNKNQTDVFYDYPSCSLIQYGDLAPTIIKTGRDGWRLNDWVIEVEHNGVSYLHLINFVSDWINAKQGSSSDVCTYRIGGWHNPYRCLPIYTLKAEIDGLRLDFINSLYGEMDNCLKEIIQGNQDYLAENWEGAVEAYRKCLYNILDGDFYDKTFDYGNRLVYILYIHIGDCYWRNNEFERAIKLFLKEACHFRNSGSFDDHFLWNHVAKCMIDWAGYRYLKCGNNSLKFIDFGKTDDAEPIDKDYVIKLENKEGPYQLYSRVLQGGFNCVSGRMGSIGIFPPTGKKNPFPHLFSFEITPFPNMHCINDYRWYLCRTDSEILLKQAQLNIDKIAEEINALGYQTDYISPSQFKWLLGKAQEKADNANEQAQTYLDARERLEQQIELMYEIEHLQDIAQTRYEMAIAEKTRANNEHGDAIEMIEKLGEKKEELEASRLKVIGESLIGSTLSFGGKHHANVGKALGGDEPKYGAIASLAIENVPSVAAAVAVGGPPGLIVFLAGAAIQEIPKIAENTWKANKKLDDEIKSTGAKIKQATREEENKRIDKYLKDKECEIASLEERYLKKKLEKMGQINLQNPAFWYDTMKIHRQLWESYLSRAIKYGWLSERALYYEISDMEDETLTIRFDYTSTNLSNIATSAAVLKNDLEILDSIRYDWYQNNYGNFGYFHLSFKQFFPGELLRIQSETRRQIVSHFRTTVKMFDKRDRTKNVFQRIKSVNCFYENVGANPGCICNVDLRNGWHTETHIENPVASSFWRTPKNHLGLEDNTAIPDWIGFEGYHISLKPAIPNMINLYPYSEEQRIWEHLENLTNDDIDQLACFENCGVEMEWTLRMSKDDNVLWNFLDDIHLEIYYWAKQDDDVDEAIWLAEGSEITHNTIIKRMSVAATNPFNKVFHPDNKYTDELQVDNNGIPFSIEESESEILPFHGARRLEGLSVLLLFDQNLVSEDQIPELKLRLRKIVNGSPNDAFEIILISPSPIGGQNDTVICEISEQLIESDPVGNWELEMRSSDNLNGQSQPIRFSGLTDIFIVFDYSCTPAD